MPTNLGRKWLGESLSGLGLLLPWLGVNLVELDLV